MATNTPLGTLQNVDIRSIWRNEERDFTPWLKENIIFISQLIGAEIEEIESETNVGHFSADLVGKIIGSGDIIVIENQYGQTDHDHLGKLQTYMAGKDAKIGVWIAEEFRDEHIATIDYLNRNMRESGSSLYAIKLEVKRIGDSEPAPSFTIVVGPNEYQRQMMEPEMTLSEKVYLEFFNEISKYFKKLNPSWNKVKAQPQNWLSFGAGRTGVNYSWNFKSMHGLRFAIELYIDTPDKENNLHILNELKNSKDDIERELGFTLDFQELPTKRACRIEHSKPTRGAITKLNEIELDGLITWGVDNMSSFIRVMSKYINELE